MVPDHLGWRGPTPDRGREKKGKAWRMVPSAGVRSIACGVLRNLLELPAHAVEPRPSLPGILGPLLGRDLVLSHLPEAVTLEERHDPI